MDLYRGGIKLGKQSLQNRARRVVILARLCVVGSPHRNPDGEEIPAPHLHIYKDGYADKWAFPAPGHEFGNPDDAWQTLQELHAILQHRCPPNDKKRVAPMTSENARDVGPILEMAQGQDHPCVKWMTGWKLLPLIWTGTTMPSRYTQSARTPVSS